MNSPVLLQFDYAADGTFLYGAETCTRDKMKSQAKQLMRNLVMFNKSLLDLPDTRVVTLKLK